MNARTIIAVSVGFLFCISLAARAEDVHVHVDVDTHWDRHVGVVIVPQSHVINAEVPAAHPARPVPAAVKITGVTASIQIIEQVATTVLTVDLQNPTASRIEAEILLPVPDNAVVRGFTFQGAAKEPTAELLTRDDARKMYDAIVSKLRDPALLEFIGCNLIRSSVFPIDANGTQKVRLTYEMILPAEGNRIDYRLPRTESIGYSVPWDITATIKSTKPISTVYSPSHAFDTARKDEQTLTVKVRKDASQNPGPFLLSYLLQQNGVSASLLAYPDPKTGGGYFLLLAGLPHALPKDAKPMPREVTLVLDHSGSMAGQKLDQVREAALQIIGGLQPNEAFNVILYNNEVEFFKPSPVLKTNDSVKAVTTFLKAVTSSGSTNLHDALFEALRQKPMDKEMLPLVLFLTDGLPTCGETSEAAITKLATENNPHKRRVFTFGVGLDVNTPLLEKIAVDSRATSTFVLPDENVEVKVGSMFSRLSGPILSDPVLDVVDADDKPVAGRIRQVLPARLPDLFDTDQLVVLGQFIDPKPIRFRLTGNYFGKPRTFHFSFALDNATTRNSFVPRLWASRRIAVLIDDIRALGANPAALSKSGASTDPRLKELVDEIVRLSKEYGILTEYTAFLAREGTDLREGNAELMTEARRNFEGRAINSRVGIGSVNQSKNSNAMREQAQLNGNNMYYDAQMQSVQVTNVQQMNDRAFFRRGGRWVDSNIAGTDKEKTPDRVVKVGSEEFNKIVKELADGNRVGAASLDNVLLNIDGKAVLLER